MNAEARLRRAFESVLDDGTPWHHPNAPICIVATKGRCVHLRLSGEPEWADMFDTLIGDLKPCTEFRLEGRDLFAKVKTDEQMAADDAAFEFDEQHGELHTYQFPDFAPVAQPKKRETKDPRGKWEKALEKFVRDYGETTFSRLALLKDACDAFEKAGTSIRIDNLNREFKKLIGRVVEEVDGTDGEEFELKGEE